MLTAIISAVAPLISFAQYGGNPRNPLLPTMVSDPRSYRCYPLCFDSKAGVVYGIRDNTFGVKLYDYRPWALGIPLFLTTEVEWRKSGNGHSYFDIDFTRDFSTLRRTFTVSPEIGYKRLVFDEAELIRQIRSGINLSYKRFTLMLGYSHQWLSQSDGPLTSQNGITLKVHREFFEHLEVNASTIYWFDDFQFSLKIMEDLFCSGVIIGVGIEKIENWSELDVSIMYRYH